MRLSFVAIFLSYVDCMRFNQLLLQRRAMLHGLATMPLAAQASDFVPGNPISEMDGSLGRCPTWEPC